MIKISLERARELGALLVSGRDVTTDVYHDAALVVHEGTGLVLKDRFGVVKESGELTRDQLLVALTESLKLQSHYAELLNMHDGGTRLTFRTVHDFALRLRAVGRL